MSEPVLLFGLEWTRPLGLAALVLVPAVLLLARGSGAPPPVPSATVELWRRLTPRATPDAHRRKVPPAAWWCALALCFGALALAGPRPVDVTPRRWRVVVDRRDAMYLDDGGTTRLERALALAADWLAAARKTGASFEWTDGVETELAAELPAAWRSRPAQARAAPEWTREDRPATVWLRDRAELPPREAALFAGGGRAVPGPAAVSGTTRWDWDGERLVEVPEGAPARCVAIERRDELAREIVLVLEAWRAARGLEACGEGRPAETALVIGPAANAAPRSASDTRGQRMLPIPRAGGDRALAIARDGWTARARVRASGGTEPGSTGDVWLASADGEPLVRVEPGRIRCALGALEEIGGDPASFAVSWSELFDAALRHPRAVIGVLERSAAGAAVHADFPGDPREKAGTERASTAISAALCAAAFGAGALALFAKRARGDRMRATESERSAAAPSAGPAPRS